MRDSSFALLSSLHIVRLLPFIDLIFGLIPLELDTMRFTRCVVTVTLLAVVPQVSAFSSVGNSFGVPRFSSTTRKTTFSLHAEGTTITMPALSSTMKEGRVVSWLKQEGDAISAGEAIMVVESDKADVSGVA